MQSWIDSLRARCGPLTDGAALFAAQLGVERDPPRGVDGLLALSRALDARPLDVNGDDDDRLFVELAGSYLAVILCDALGHGAHAQRKGQHRLDLGRAFFDPFGAVERALAADDARRALAHEVARCEAEASGAGPCARVMHEVERQLRRLDASASILDRFDGTVRVRFADDEVELDLSRVVRATCELDAAAVAKAVERFLSVLPGMRSSASAWQEARLSVLPRPVGPKLLAGLPLESGLLLAPLLAEPAPAQLAFVLRGERRARYVQARDAASWDASSAQIRAAAIENLASRSERTKLVCTDTEHGPIVVAKSGDGLDAARVVLPGLVDVLAPELGLPFAVAIPHRDALLACPLGAKGAVAHLQRTAREQAARAPHAISAHVMKLDRQGLALL